MTDVEQFAAWLRDQLAAGAAFEIQAEQLPALKALLRDYDRLKRAQARRIEQARRAGRLGGLAGGRPRTDNPAASTLRSRESRERKRQREEAGE